MFFEDDAFGAEDVNQFRICVLDGNLEGLQTYLHFAMAVCFPGRCCVLDLFGADRTFSDFFTLR